MNRTDTRILGWYLVLHLAVLLAAGCKTSDAVRGSSHQVKKTAKDVSEAIEPVKPLLQESTLVVTELHDTVALVNQRAPATLDRVDALVDRIERVADQWERAGIQVEALAAHYRGKTPGGETAAWVTKLKRWAWLLVFGLLVVPSPLQRQQRQALARGVQWLMAVLSRKPTPKGDRTG